MKTKKMTKLMLAFSVLAVGFIAMQSFNYAEKSQAKKEFTEFQQSVHMPKCGEGKCGDDKAVSDTTKKKEAKCDSDKMKESKCDADKKTEAKCDSDKKK
jgi:uncharacterized low-complexity protein